MAQTRILFIDDEPNVISGLRRLLRGFRNEWQMEFSTSPVEAIERLSTGEFDVVVTDMRMPHIDGAKVLQAVMERSPQSVRVVLSGQADQDRILETVNSAHLFLTKPCPTERLKDTITRACSLRDRLKIDELKREISRVSTVPIQKSVHERFINLINREQVTIEEVGQVVACDVCLTAKLLQLVSSSFFGQPRRIQHPCDPVHLLGLELIRRLAGSTDSFKAMPDHDLDQFSLEKLNAHSIEVAHAAKAIAAEEIDSFQVQGEAYMAGMLHDVGKIVLASTFPESYCDAVRLANSSGISLWESEMKVFGASHAEVGAYLLGLWGVSDPIIEAIKYCRQPELSLHHGMHPLMAVHAANLMKHKDVSEHPPGGYPNGSSFLRKSEFANRLEHWQDIACSYNTERGC